MKKLIVEGIEDVHVDPHLKDACARDINNYCQNVPEKSGNSKFDTYIIDVIVVVKILESAGGLVASWCSCYHYCTLSVNKP